MAATICVLLADDPDGHLTGTAAQLMLVLVALSDGQGLITFLLYGFQPEVVAAAQQHAAAAQALLARARASRLLCCLDHAHQVHGHQVGAIQTMCAAESSWSGHGDAAQGGGGGGGDGAPGAAEEGERASSSGVRRRFLDKWSTFSRPQALL